MASIRVGKAIARARHKARPSVEKNLIVCQPRTLLQPRHKKLRRSIKFKQYKFNIKIFYKI